ncbi:uncharacterized protein LOC122040146 [Zingiber officinale]|uniref:Uncharacterized protein n=1 Tax=Zingiber officinale TaxID=94328 RepID=A0A8J5HZ27_ZINOF|nr:uncharacterized protein LOC122040146 [Zingiber officinale]KAG6529707.1 hypothetical protein ZIOFF_011920 [Zingiber officinale]
MDSRLLHPSTLSPNPCCFPRPRLSPRPRLLLPRATTDGDATDAGDRQAESAAVPSSPSPPALNIRYRSRSRVRRQEEQQKSAPRKQPPPKKDWESMTPGEKAVELYVGEKGLLFWLNKIAYALIFVIAGGWILFRFIGPALGLYQLDSAPLSPSAIFKASP